MEKGQKKISMESFFTTPKAEEGVKLFLHLPSGEKTEEFLLIKGIDSEDFKRASIKSKRQLVEIFKNLGDKSMSEDEEMKLVEEKEISRCSSLITGWSFDYECTQENKEKLLSMSPAMIDKIITFASDRSNFFTGPSSN